MTLDELKARLDSFSPRQIAFVATVVDSLSNPPRADIQQHGTWLTGSANWMEYFGLALSVHHGATTEPLGLTAFETVFRNACQAAEWEVDPRGPATRRFVDLEVVCGNGPPRRLSLKSTAAQKLSETTAHISKLTEAAWVQDTRMARDRRDSMRELFRSYREAVDAIIMLRAFRKEGIPIRYQLLEIPTTLFASVQDAPLEVYQRDAPLIECKIDEQTVAVIATDRSDAKITVRKIRLSACIVHAEWARHEPAQA